MMKTNVLQMSAVAVAGFCSTLAMAQSSVTLYGLVDLGVRVDRTTSGSRVALQSGMGSGSRWGLRGSEDLGGGLRANFVFEQGFNADTGTAALNGATAPGFGRQAFLGLSSASWGTFNLGRQYTPIFNFIAGRIDPLGYGLIGNLTNSMGLQSGTPARADNALSYTSPQWHGLRGELMWSLGESSAAGVPGRAGDQRGASLTYAAGPWVAGYAYHDTRGAKDVAIQPAQRRHVIGTVYDFKLLKLHAAYGVNKNEAMGAARIDRRNHSLGVTVPLATSTTLIVQHQTSNDRTSADADVRQLSVAMIHYLSKRTDVYVSVAKTDNRNAAAFGLTDGSVGSLGTIAPASNPSAFQIGIRHRF